MKFDDSAIINQKYDFKELVKKFIDYSNITILDYSDVEQEEVVEKALYLKKPFQEEEKGYRDTMIWLSLLAFVKTNNIEEEVIFISSNKNDFFEKKKILDEKNDEVEVLNFDDIFENDLKIFKKNFNKFNKIVNENFEKISKDKKENLTKEIEFLNKKIEKILKEFN